MTSNTSKRRTDLARRLLTSAAVRTLAAIQSPKPDAADLYFAYRLLLKRKAEPQGWHHWSKNISEGISLHQLVQAFLTSGEYRRAQTVPPHKQVDYDSFIIFVDPEERAFEFSIVQGAMYEPHVSRNIAAMLTEDSVFVDIGANIGWYTLLAASIARRGKVIAIEPNRKNNQLMLRSLAANRFDNVVIHSCAATDKRQVMQLEGHGAYGSVHEAAGTDDEYVQGELIDGLLANESRIDVIKIDVEGYEPVALRGMLDTLRRHQPVIFTEFHPMLIKNHAREAPETYLEALLAEGYALSIVEETGNLAKMSNARDVMTTWQEINMRLNAGGEDRYLDLLATPSRNSQGQAAGRIDRTGPGAR